MFDEALAAVTDTPALVIDWRTVRRNVDQMASLARDRQIDLRPHIKTHKLTPLARLQVDAGAIGITVAKLGEAEVMADAGLRDIFVAYPVVGAEKIARFLALAQRARLSVAVDSFDVASAISAAAAERSLQVTMLVEIDTGLHRCGVAPGPEAVALVERIVELPGAHFAGLMTHEGHAYAAGIPEGLRRATESAATMMVDTRDLLAQAGINCEVVTMGSSGTARFGIGLDGITEFRPGTYVFNDRSQVALGAASPDDCAVAVLTTVVSRARPLEAVLDSGNKTLTSDRILIPDPPSTFGHVAGHPGSEILRLSEEHAILGGPLVATLRVGDRVAIIPNHVCPVVNLFDEAVVITDDGSLERWPVDARGRSR